MGQQTSAPCSCSRGVGRLFQLRDGNPRESCTLRIIHITDVYVLDNFPHLRNLIKDKTQELTCRGGGKTISMLTGDFLAPYLLASIDKGAGMMTMINATPIDYLTWGNHEDDVGDAAVMQREREYKGCWINTNMQSHASFPESTCQTDAEVIEVMSVDGINRRRVGMMGILSNSPSLYRPNAFGGATIEDPWETMAAYREKLTKEKKCDFVLPLCHLYEPQDERTCREFDFPLILSGHDHHVVDKVVEGTRLLKPGLDGHKAWLVDICWPSLAATEPRITAELLTVKNWPADPELVELSKKAQSVLDPLKHTQLAFIPSMYRPLSSFNARGCRVSMGTYLLSRIRDALNMYDPLGGAPSCDAAMLKGGNVRGGRNYADDEHLTLEVLQSELEETKIIVTVPVPGFVLKVGLRETYTAPNPGWMQYDDGVELDADGFVTHVGGQPLDLSKTYKVASISDFWRKRDSPTIGSYFEMYPKLVPEPDCGVPMHALLLRLFALQIWARIWKKLEIDPELGIIQPEAFRMMDKDGDGKLSREDIKQSIQGIAGMETFAGQDIVVDRMFQEMQTFQRQTSEYIDQETVTQALKSVSNSSLASMSQGDESDDGE